MIKFIREYKNRYGHINYDVVHESNDNTRWYLYTPEDLPKTAKRFIEKSKTIIPYNDDNFQEYGRVYW